MQINGDLGQQITLTHCEKTDESGYPIQSNINSFGREGYFQVDKYISDGTEEQTWSPSFTYHGFKYVIVEGLKDIQATESLLIAKVWHSNLRELGGFECSDEIINKLQKMVRLSTLGNFFYFPIDCPHREKNGWTGDAAISCEHTLLNLDASKSYSEWLKSIRAAQLEDGSIPVIIPTGGWGKDWGKGPAWDCVLTYLPFYSHVYTGDVKILIDNQDAIFKYLNYIVININEKGLVAIGLGDWCPPGRTFHDYKCPVEVSSTLISIDICRKAANIFDLLELLERKKYADEITARLIDSFRENLVDYDTLIVSGNCQTSQSMALYYDVLKDNEINGAFENLVKMIEETKYHIDCGILGARVIFHTLTRFNRSDLAYKMITIPTIPSYAYMVLQGSTTILEDFDGLNSLNHHFFGDISSWFIKEIAGIKPNPNCDNIFEIEISPNFIEELTYAKGFHIMPYGEIESYWQRIDNKISLNISVPNEVEGKIILPKGYIFEDSQTSIIYIQEIKQNEIIIKY